ncbi:MAG: translocation/assembly module TamB domain-containing protein, partial [Polyangia bacterium]
VAFKVREVLLGKGALKLDPGADAVHLSGSFFDNLVTVDGWLTLVPKVSVAAKITVKNLPLEKLVPEMQSLAEIHGLATGEISFTIDSEAGFTFAKLDLTQLTLTLTSTDENGRPQRLVVKNQDTVQATFDGHTVNIKQANLYSRIGEFTMHGTVGKVNNVYMKGQINLELLEYFFRGLFEHTHGPATLELTISGDLQRPDVTGYVKIGGGKGPAELVPRGLEGKLTLVVPSGKIDITPQTIRLTEVVLSTENGKEARASGKLAIDHWEPGAIEASIKGEISPRLFQWGLPEQVGDASGAIALDVRVGGVWSRPTWSGTATVKDVLFRARKLEREIKLDGGTIAFDNFDIAIGCPRTGQRREGCTSMRGTIDEEQHLDRIDGRVSFGEGLSLRNLDIWLDGSDIAYSQPGWAAKFSPQVELVGNGTQLTLRGNIDIVEGRYAQNFDLAGMIFTPKRTREVSEPFWQGIPLLETMRLQLHAQSRGTLFVKNNIADLPLTANVEVSGTLSEPRLDGQIRVEEGGRISPPGFRYSFDTDQGQVTFEAQKKIPDETPTIDLTAKTTYIDNYEQQHELRLLLSGTALSPRLDLTSAEGWTRNQVLQILLLGQTPDEIRRITQGSAVPQVSTGGSATDTVAKTVTGATLGQFISDPLRRQLSLDTVILQFGGSSVQLDACKRITRGIKACGQGEIGFTGASKFGGSLELRISDRPAEFGGVGRIEYLTHGVETLQDSLTSGRGELRLRVPLGY